MLLRRKLLPDRKYHKIELLHCALTGDKWTMSQDKVPSSGNVEYLLKPELGFGI